MLKLHSWTHREVRQVREFGYTVGISEVQMRVEDLDVTIAQVVEILRNSSNYQNLKQKK